jgi:hypothetical protein
MSEYNDFQRMMEKVKDLERIVQKYLKDTGQDLTLRQAYLRVAINEVKELLDELDPGPSEL